ncbi:CYTH domain-containing protein [Inhella gelatinilytica]|uniref:CYTH domain-containing protein n=1 Tax=Inhella gelatinilytica TaxID=2795030 RepID=A0A931NDY5_9BURK|nr:CYTH domain-containing protein [Inhella gelatinilytica]MBH9553592.1 CYTH domain-containing protein [Inhella gelatinilytica]
MSHRELEIRLNVPDAALGAVWAWLLELPGAFSLPMAATYFDTEASELAQAGWGLRLRREGELWVQTLKGPALDDLSRPEHEVPREVSAGRPALDLALHHDFALGAAVLAGLRRPLIPTFSTEIERLRVPLPLVDCAVEMALDLGQIHAGGRSLRVQELELEWKAGELGPLLDLAEALVRQHGLLWEPRTKAARGHALSHGRVLAAPEADVESTLTLLQHWREQARSPDA